MPLCCSPNKTILCLSRCRKLLNSSDLKSKLFVAASLDRQRGGWALSIVIDRAKIQVRITGCIGSVCRQLML